MTRRDLAVLYVKGLDLVWMLASFAVATWVVAYHASGEPVMQLLSIRLKVANFVLFVGFMILWQAIFAWLGLYRSRRLTSSLEESIDVLKATSLGSGAVLIAGFLFDVVLITPQFILVFWLCSTVLTVVGRLFLRWALHRMRIHGRNLRYILVVGSNDRALRFAERLRSTPELGFRLVGFVDEEWHGIGGFHSQGERLVCDLEDLPDYLRSQIVDEVVIALPASSSYMQSARIIGLCEEQGINVRLLSDLFNLRLARAHVEVFQDEPTITLSTGAMRGSSLVVKRGVDLVLATPLLVLQLPVFAMIAAVIKLTSRGPVFFKQERIGLNKRRFPMIKFRTMVVDAESRMSAVEHLNESEGPVFKIQNDPRITSFGGLLRKTSLDEMPQLINVVRGEMSLVGPRPLPVRDYDGFDEDWHRRRFSVRPGITCLWQVKGRSSLPFEQWMELDMKYIDEWSLWLDFKILLQTIPAVLRGEGAA